MRSKRWLRVLAVFSVLAIVAAACGDDDDGDATDDTTDTTAAGDGGEGGEGGEGLVIGQIGPQTGPLAFLGPPQFAGFELAIEDINAAGGVNGAEVSTLIGDEAGDEALARDAANRLLGEGADAIVGAASSGMSQSFIQILFDNGIVQCSPSNTSPVFSDQENAGFYHRTVPPDEAVTPIIANEVVNDGATSAAVVARADDYGNALADLVEGELDAAGVTVTKIVYDPNAASFDAEIGQVVDAAPDAVVLISFDEGAPIVAGLIESGFTGDQFYGADGVFSPTFNALVNEADPSVVDGMKLIGASGSADFNERLNVLLEAEGEAGNFIYGGQAYDCAVVIALAAEAAGSNDPADFVAEMANVTGGGTTCESFESCAALLANGEDIDYDGASGPLDLDENGDPTFGRYAIAQFQEGALVPLSDNDVDVTTLG